MVNNYETVIILKTNVEKEASENFGKKVEALITSNGGELVKVEEMGKRVLAYEVKKEREGYYVLFTFKAQSTFIKEFERILKLDEIVLKHLVVKLEENKKTKQAENKKTENKYKYKNIK